MAILARLLEPQDFGVFAAAVTVIEFVRPISALSVDHALVQSKELTPGTTAFASIFGLGLSSIVALLIAFFSDATLLLYDEPEVPAIVRSLALSVPLGALSGLLLAVLRRKLAFQELSILVVISTALAAAASIGMAVAGFGIWALVAGYYADLLLRALFGLHLVRPRFVRPRLGPETRKLLRFGTGTTLSLTLNFWGLHGDYVVIGSVLGSKPLGHYSRAYQLIATVPGLLGHLHNMVLFPAFSRAQTDKGYLATTLSRGTQATAALTLPLCAWGVVLGPELIPLLLGPGWEPAILPFQILSLGVYFRSAYRFAASIIWATGHVFTLSACQGIYGALIVIGALIGAQWGIPGVAIATLIALFAFYALLYLATARVTGAPLWSFIRLHAGPATIFVVAGASAMLARRLFLALDPGPIGVIIGTLGVSVGALALATMVLRSWLWGTIVYEQGLRLLGRYSSAGKTENEEHDDRQP